MKAYGALVATTETPPIEIPEIVTISVGPPSEIVSVAVRLSPLLLEGVDESVVMMEDGRLELEVNVVGDVDDAMLELERSELDVIEVVDALVRVAVLGGRGLEGVLRGIIDNVVFLAGHPEDPASRRTGQ